MKLRTALAALLLVSCADDAIYWDLPPDMLPEERAAFGEACERWNYVAIRQQFINEPGGGGTHRVLLSLPEHMWSTAEATGEYVPAAHVMHVNRGLSRDVFLLNVLHEQGHALGLSIAGRDGVDRHVPGPGVMNIHGGQIEFSEGDLAECRRVNACR